MKYKPNYEESKNRWIEYWNRENHDRPLLDMVARNEKISPKPVRVPDSLYERWTDVEYLIASNRSYMEQMCYLGDSFPLACPNLGPDFTGATFGTDIIFEKYTSYGVPVIKDWSEELTFREDNKWWKMMLDMTRAFVDDACGDYVVGITDMHPGVDGVVSLRGPQNTCYDMYDNPEKVVALAEKIFEAYKFQLAKLYEITEKNNTGCSNWMGIWSPELWYPTSCDFICMISEDMFTEYIVPVIEKEVNMLNGRTLFHLDGPGAVKHLDTLLDIPGIAGIQWIQDPGQPLFEWMDMLKKIQSKGKLLHINATADELPVIAEELTPEGLSVHLNFTPTVEEAHSIIKLMTVK